STRTREQTPACAGMGNCQAADAAAVVIQHPASGRTELAYWSLPAGEVMAANPGHYVAAVITAPHTASEGGGAAPVKHLKLLRPDDTLLLGRVYRLVSFEGTSRPPPPSSRRPLRSLALRRRAENVSRR
uniref:Uncharacterized protein n=1 Tax=Aegilops tauschii subsp. strangulata TaxID=200361 RepID=A0A453IQK7_AEGTS